MFIFRTKKNKLKIAPPVLHHTIPSSMLPSGNNGNNVIITSTPTGATPFNGKPMYASAVTYSWFDPEEAILKRKKELMAEFEQNPELFSEIIVELRNRKIKKLQQNI